MLNPIVVKDVRNILGVKTFVSKIKCVSESHPLKKCVPETGKFFRTAAGPVVGVVSFSKWNFAAFVFLDTS